MSVAQHPTAATAPRPIPVAAMATCSAQWVHALTCSGVGGYPRVAREVTATLALATVDDLDRHTRAVLALYAALSEPDRLRVRRHATTLARTWWTKHS